MAAFDPWALPIAMSRDSIRLLAVLLLALTLFWAYKAHRDASHVEPLPADPASVEVKFDPPVRDNRAE